MKITDILNEMTSAGAIATVAQPMTKKLIRRKKPTSERKLSKPEIRKRDNYADDLPDAEFKKRYGKDWEEVKYGTATNMAKKKTKESVQLDEYRATNILGFMSGLRKHPDVEKIVDIVSQADGQSALVRTKDGNAYEIQVRQAGMSQHPGIQKHTKKDKE